MEQALAARGQGIEIVAIGTGDADRDYLRRLASSEHALDLRPQRRAGSDLRAHRPGHRRGRPRLAGTLMTRTAAAAHRASESRVRPQPARPRCRVAGPRSARRTTWPSPGPSAALFGLYLYVELVHAGVGRRPRRAGRRAHRRLDRLLPQRLGAVSRRGLAPAGPRGGVGRAGRGARRGDRAGARRARHRPVPGGLLGRACPGRSLAWASAWARGWPTGPASGWSSA